VNRKAFTLIELLVVIAIIALLVAILLPSLSRAKDLAKRAVCGANINSAGKAIYLYASQKDGMLPHPGNPAAGNFRNVGYLRGSAVPPLTNNWANSRGLWLLVRNELASPDLFVCPATEHTPSPLKTSGGGEAYDFNNHKTLSYSYQNQWTIGTNFRGTTIVDPPGVAVLADRNACFPETGWKPNSGADNGDYGLPDSTKKSENSENHKKEGQSVLFLDGSVSWCKSPKAGVNQDNIWTRSDGVVGSDGANISVLSERLDEQDSFLIP